MSKVRYLLRVSSNQQLDAEGDIPSQRKIVRDYIEQNREWILDEKKPEYAEMGISGFKNSVSDRDILNEIKKDAQDRQFNILVCYKDDRLGRRKYEVPEYIETLKKYGVLIYSVKDGLLTPMNNMEDLITFIRYWHAERSSAETGIRVRDSMKELVKAGKFTGGRAAYGYKLVFSGEYSKHQRALKKYIIVPEKAEMVKKIFNMALMREYGAQKIAKELNRIKEYQNLAPNGYSWKTGTIRSILMNPIYTGYFAYNRREHRGEEYKRLDRANWIYSEVCNEEIKIIDLDSWEKVQRIREKRKNSIKFSEEKASNLTTNTAGSLLFIDVLYCGYCGKKMSNGSKYNYWITKNGEKKKSYVGYYRCQTKHQGEVCRGKSTYRADMIEPILSVLVKKYLQNLENHTYVIEKIKESKEFNELTAKKELNVLYKRLDDMEKDMETMQESLPKVLRGEIKISLEIFNRQIENYQKKAEIIQNKINILEENKLENKEKNNKFSELIEKIPAWKDVFDNADITIKRVIINKLIERAEMKENEIKIRFQINRNDFFNKKADFNEQSAQKDIRSIFEEGEGR